MGLEKNQNAAGPLKWMAPEALSYQYVKKTDVWSYGVALIEMNTKGMHVCACCACVLCCMYRCVLPSS